jgi:cupin fold WbuC family metalloprotein
MNTVDLARLDRVSAAARGSARLRMNDNLHQMEDVVHRLLNATEPGTYVQPHRHRTPPKVETVAVLRGRGAVLIFDDRGKLTEKSLLAPSGPDLVCEIPAGAWHSLVALAPGTVWFEVKLGPYAPPPPEDVASFAPAPGTPDAERYLAKMLQLVS